MNTLNLEDNEYTLSSDEENKNTIKYSDVKLPYNNVNKHKTKKQKISAAQFLELEAKEGDDEIDEEDGNLFEDEKFLDDDYIEDQKNDYLTHQSLTNNEIFQSSRTNVFQTKLNQLEEKYAEEELSENDIINSNEEEDKENTDELHDTADYEDLIDEELTLDQNDILLENNIKLVSVRVTKIGVEKDVIFNIMKKYNELSEKEKKKWAINAITYNFAYKGKLFIESNNFDAINKYILSNNNVIRKSIQNVPIGKVHEMLNRFVTKVIKYKKGDWVRILRSDYMNSIGLVSDIDENKRTVSLRIIPKIDLEALSEKYSSAPQENHKVKNKRLISQACISINDIHRYNIPYEFVSTFTNAYCIKNQLIEENTGFLIKTLKMSSITHDKPTKEELDLFLAAAPDLEALVGAPINFESTINHNIVENQHIEVIDGDLKGLKGIVTEKNRYLIKIITDDNKYYTIDPSICKKCFEISESVIAISGPHAGESGLVIAIDDNTVTVLDTESHNSFTTDLLDIIPKYDGLNVGQITSLNEFSVGNLVNIHAKKTVGVIVKIYHTRKAKILTASGVQLVMLTEISKQSNDFQPTATDSQNTEFMQGANVTFTDDNNSIVRAVVIHIWEDYVFLKCEKLVQYSGYVCLKAENVTVANQLNKKFFDARTKHGFSIIKQKKLMGNEVNIVNGIYKGQTGQIRSIDGNEATVLIPAQGKEITVSLNSIKFTDQYNEAAKYAKRMLYTKITNYK